MEWLGLNLPTLRSKDYFDRKNSQMGSTAHISSFRGSGFGLKSPKSVDISRAEIQNFINNTRGSPKKYLDLQSQIEQVRIAEELRNAAKGHQLAKECNDRLRRRKQEEAKEKRDFLDSVAINSDSMLHATRTLRFCQPNWDENPNNYQILSRMNQKMISRFNDICKYGVKQTL